MTTRATRAMHRAARAATRRSFASPPASSRASPSRASRARVVAAAAGRRPVLARASSSSASSSSTGPWNTAPLVMSDDLYAYVLRHTREPAVLRALREETSALRGARMQVAPEQGALLALAVEMIGARRVDRDRHVHRVQLDRDGARDARRGSAVRVR